MCWNRGRTIVIDHIFILAAEPNSDQSVQETKENGDNKMDIQVEMQPGSNETPQPTGIV